METKSDKREEFVSLRDIEGVKSFGSVSKWFVALAGIGLSLFSLYIAAFGVLPPLDQRPVHLGFIMIMGFLSYRSCIFRPKSGLESAFNIALVGIALMSVIWLIHSWERIMVETFPNTVDIIMSAVLTLVLLEAARRVIGWPLPIIGVCALVYVFVGPYMPGMLAHRGYNAAWLATRTWAQTEGIFGVPLGVCTDYVTLFLLFGAVLGVSGASKYLMDLAMGISGWTKGGPAKVAVVSSSFMAMLSGSPVANVATTGAVTIPLMKRYGFSPVMAGAVEAVASTGGQMMPPVMGASAFIIAEFTGNAYVDVCIAAFGGATLYFISLFFMVHFYATKKGYAGLPKAELPDVWSALKDGGHLLIPIVILVILLLLRYSVMYSILYCIIALYVLAMTRKNTRMNLRQILLSLEAGGRNMVVVSVACASAGLIIGVITLTGLGNKITNMIFAISGGHLLLALIFTMIISLILGMGLPTSACYIFLATLGAPALVKMGAPLLGAHLFILYFGAICNITPPICLAAYTGAGIAGGPPLRTGFMATRLGIVLYIVPYIFVYNPALMFHGTFVEIAEVFLVGVAAVLAFAAVVENYMFFKITLPERIMLFIAGITLAHPNRVLSVIGLVILGIVLLRQWRIARSKSRLSVSVP
jgi:TRAP transporter 4TM/12TM fusion protein